MKKSFKLLMVLLSTAVLSTASFGASDEFKFLPVFTDASYTPDFEVAVVTGYMDYTRNGIDDSAVYGAELSFDCPVFTLPGDNPLRQQLSINRYNKKGLKVTTIEMNPYYFIDLAKDLTFGFGPAIGAVRGDPTDGDAEWLFSAQVGAGVKYYINNFLVGADIRYQWTTEKSFGGTTDVGLDNTRFLLKAGYRF